MNEKINPRNNVLRNGDVES